MRAEPPVRRAVQARRDVPIWKQALEGIGLVAALAALVTSVGAALALLVSLLF